MNWPAAKFELMYDAHVRRCTARDLESRRLATVSGVMGNSNFEGGEEAMTRIEEDFDDIIASVYGVKKADDWNFADDPFFAAMKLPDVPENRLREEDDKLFAVRYDVDQI
jgi:hypothetical protein